MFFQLEVVALKQANVVQILLRRQRLITVRPFAVLCSTMRVGVGFLMRREFRSNLGYIEAEKLRKNRQAAANDPTRNFAMTV